jgi:hypothetical protein
VGAIETSKVAITKLARVIASIPISARAEDSEIYTVTAQ